MGANPLIRALVLGTFPMGAGGDSDLSGFSIEDPGEQESGVAFNLSITGATDTAGDALSGAIAVTVVSGDDGEVYDDTPTFTAGAATLSSITLTTVDTQTLTVTIDGVTDPETVQVVVVAADLSGFTIVDPGEQAPSVAFDLDLTDGTDTAGDPLSGAIAVTVVSNLDGEVYSDSPTFTDGDATLSGITLTTEDEHTLTVTVTGVTDPNQIGVTVAAAPTNASEFLLSLNPDGYWKLGEASGDALDYSGNGNDGTVTLGTGTRATAALDDMGDGSITLAASASNVSIANNAGTNQNLWAGGGCVGILIQKSSSSSHIVLGKGNISNAGWYLATGLGGAGEIRLVVFFSGGAGVWVTAGGVLDLNEPNLIYVIFDSDSASNNPTIVHWSATSGASIFTVGSGLTESTAPSGTYNSDAAFALVLNNTQLTQAGIYDEFAIWSSSPPSTDDIEDYITLAAGL